MGGVSSLYAVFAVEFSMDQYFDYTIMPLLAILLALLASAFFWRFSRKADLNRLTLAAPCFISVWALLNGHLVEGPAGQAVTWLGAFGFLSVAVIFAVLYYANRSSKTAQTNQVAFKINTYPSYPQSDRTVFAPARWEFENGSVLCVNCNVYVPSHYVACWKCGTFLDDSYFIKSCTGCGRKLPAHTELCDQCGSRLSDAPAWK
ncbi:MAG: zinc ribbon domain-containing protein [Actinobacteria bacterium]|nr:zinc ribbon domain-containing protein [Actinomycetota bacterium]